jgi:hypothetical protein
MATIEFSVSRNQIPAGECATLRWRVDGVKEVYVYAEGERWREHGVVGEGQREVCPTETKSYYLRAIHRDDSREDRQIVLTVQGGTPAIQHFGVDRDEIRKGECVNFRWHVEGVKEVYFHREDIDWRDKGVAGIAEAQRCPNNTSTFCLRVVKRDNSVERRCITVRVR